MPYERYILLDHTSRRGPQFDQQSGPRSDLSSQLVSKSRYESAS